MLSGRGMLPTWVVRMRFVLVFTGMPSAGSVSRGILDARPGIMIGTIPTLVDYRGGTSITGTRHGNTIVMHVPASVVGDGVWSSAAPSECAEAPRAARSSRGMWAVSDTFCSSRPTFVTPFWKFGYVQNYNWFRCENV